MGSSSPVTTTSPNRHGTTISKIKAATNRIAGRPVGLGRPQSIAFGDGALWVPSGSYLSALRGLADAIGADPAIKTVRSARVARGEPGALTHDEFALLLQMPDRRTRQGKRDLALLHLLGAAGLRRAEAAKLLVGDVDERRRAGDVRLRKAISRSTSWWVTVRYSKRGRTRAIPLDEGALAAIAA